MKSLISFIICLCCVTGIYAQPKLYEETKQIQGDGYTYQCETDGVVVDLYNTNQQFVKTDQINRKTGEYSGTTDAYILQLERDTWTRSKCFTIVRKILDICLYIHPDTGKIIDVSFSFGNRDNFSTIPLSVYRKIELELKKNIWFVPTEHGKQFNYILLWWEQIVIKCP